MKLLRGRGAKNERSDRVWRLGRVDIKDKVCKATFEDQDSGVCLEAKKKKRDGRVQRPRSRTTATAQSAQSIKSTRRRLSSRTRQVSSLANGRW